MVGDLKVIGDSHVQGWASRADVALGLGNRPDQDLGTRTMPEEQGRAAKSGQ